MELTTAKAPAVAASNNAAEADGNNATEILLQNEKPAIRKTMIVMVKRMKTSNVDATQEVRAAVVQKVDLTLVPLPVRQAPKPAKKVSGKRVLAKSPTNRKRAMGKTMTVTARSTTASRT